MRRIVIMVCAAVIASTSLAEAQYGSQRRHNSPAYQHQYSPPRHVQRHHRYNPAPRYHNRGNYNTGAAIAAGVGVGILGGLIGGMLMNESAPPPPYPVYPQTRHPSTCYNAVVGVDAYGYTIMETFCP